MKSGQETLIELVKTFREAKKDERVQISSTKTLLCTHFARLDLSDQKSEFKRLDLIRSESPYHYEKSKDRSNIEVTTNDRKKYLLFVPQEKRAECYKLFASIDQTSEERAFSQTYARARVAANWHSTAKTIYKETSQDDTMAKFYHDLHTVFAEKTEQIVRQQKMTSVRIVAMGCGDGHEVKTTVERLQKHSELTVAGIGFDRNPDNFTQYEEEQKNAAQPLSYLLTTGNTLNLFKLHEQYKNNEVFAKLDQKQAKTIILFSGSVTHLVLRGTTQGLSVLQQAFRCGEAALFAGTTEVLFNKRTAKRAGWKCDRQKLRIHADTVDYLYQLERPTTEERKAWLVKQFNKNRNNSTLDLSMSSNPLADLRLLKEAKVDFSHIRTIDLRWIFLLAAESEDFYNELRIFANRGISAQFALVDGKDAILDFKSKLSWLGISSNSAHYPYSSIFCSTGEPIYPELPPYSRRFMEQYEITAVDNEESRCTIM